MRVSRRYVISGRVQGVGFRYSTKELARGFEVCGSVRNLPDGTVEIMVAGDKEEVDGFLKELTEESSVASHIKDVRVEAAAVPDGVRGFTIAR